MAKEKGTPITYGHVGNALVITLVLAVLWGAGAYWLDKTGMTGYVRCEETDFFSIKDAPASSSTLQFYFDPITVEHGVTCPGGKQYK